MGLKLPQLWGWVPFNEISWLGLRGRADAGQNVLGGAHKRKTKLGFKRWIQKLEISW